MVKSILSFLGLHDSDPIKEDEFEDEVCESCGEWYGDCDEADCDDEDCKSF